MERTIEKVLADNDVNKEGLAKEITESVKADILKFHEFQNGELMKELLIKSVRINKLESRINEQENK